MSGSLGKSQSKSGNRSDQRVWGEQAPYLQDLYGQAQNQFNNPNASQGAGYDMQGQYAQSQGLQDIIGGAQSAWQSQLTPQENPYLQQAMQSAIRPLTQNYQENVLSGITDQAVQSGQSGSSRQGIAEGIAGRGYMDQVGDITNRMAFGDYSAGMDRQANAYGQAGTMANLGMLPGSYMRDVGDQDYNNLARYQGIIGGPTTLGSSTGSSKSNAWNIAGGM